MAISGCGLTCLSSALLCALLWVCGGLASAQEALPQVDLGLPPGARPARAALYDCDDAAQMEALAARAREGGTPALQSVRLECDPTICVDPSYEESFLRLMGLCVGMSLRLPGTVEEPEEPPSPPPEGATPAEGSSGEGAVVVDEDKAENKPIYEAEEGAEEGAEAEEPKDEGEAAAPSPRRSRQSCDLEDARELVNAARKRLERTGLFEAVVVRCKEVEGGLAVTFKANAAQIIRQIEYVNTSPLLESEVAKRLQLRRGQAMPSSLKELEERLDSIRDLYRQAEGLYDTQVTLKRAPVEGTNLLDLEVEITRGRELKVSRVVIGGHTVFRYSRLRSLLLEPIGWFGAYRDSAFKEGIELILREYRKEGYFQARVVDKAVITDVAAGKVELRLELSEGPPWDVEFVGNRELSASELRQKTTFLNTGYVDRVEIERSAQELEALYETTGYFFAQVEPRESRDPTGRNRLTFQITEGARGEIRSIGFEGAKALSESELLDQIKTSTYGLLSGGTLQRKELQADLGQIVAAYQERGYLQAQAPSWSMSVSPAGDAYDVKIQVKEGPQTRLAEIALEGNQGLSDELILGKLESRDGEVLSLGRLANDQGRVLQLYRARGFPLANVQAMCSDDQRRWGPCEAPSLRAECFPEDEEALCEGGFAEREVRCQRVRPGPDCRPAGGIRGERVWVRFQITEGERLKVGEIFLRGNFRTRPQVILDSLNFKTGDDFSPVALYESQSELRRIGLFEAVSIETIGLSEDDVIAQITRQNRVVIVIQVEELPARFLDVRFGFETRNLLQDNASLIGRTEAALVENNLLGYGMGVQLKLQAAMDLLQIIDLADPTSVLSSLECVQCLDWFVAVEALYFDPRSVFWRAEWTVSLFYSLDLIGLEIFSLEKENFGARTSVRKQLDERLVGQLSLEQSWTSTRNREEDPRNAEGERLFSPQRVLTKPALKLTYDKRNSPLNPTRGYYLEFTPELAFDFLFGSGTNFFKVSGGGSQFWTWFRSLTLAYGVRFGYTAPLLDAQAIPEDELFRLGGTGSLRGFGLNSVGPLSSNLFQARGGEFMLRAHGELRFPLFRELDIYGVYFVDGGFLVDCRAEVSPLNPQGVGERVGCWTDLFTTGKSTRNEYLRGSSGLGLRWLLLGQIPVVLDYGVILDRQLGEPFGDLQFNVGYNF